MYGNLAKLDRQAGEFLLFDTSLDNPLDQEEKAVYKLDALAILISPRVDPALFNSSYNLVDPMGNLEVEDSGLGPCVRDLVSYSVNVKKIHSKQEIARGVDFVQLGLEDEEDLFAVREEDEVLDPKTVKEIIPS
ncbi:unnamed protein product [Schistocephalus solidus]|uniref:LAM_G_DOMAIN domain-containing protein n=1 Tax=Schistocephalus solidus TaxID=70667 RepID=A0A183SZT2_SCHSO|nr:unnamed protein product [Schistocephalus solidus]